MGCRPDRRPDMIITNPPWDMRLNEGAGESWDRLGEFIRGQEGCEGWVLTGNRLLLKRIRLASQRTLSLSAAGLDLAFVRFSGRSGGMDSSEGNDGSKITAAPPNSRRIMY